MKTDQTIEGDVYQLDEYKEDTGDHPDVETGDIGDPRYRPGKGERKKERPALAGKHGSEGEEDGHGDGQPLCNALRRQEEGQPGDSKVDRGGQVGLDQVVPSTEWFLCRINIYILTEVGATSDLHIRREFELVCT